MAETPKGREIKWIAGNGTDIEARGEQIENLGQQMIDAAAILKSIADGADTMKGLSVSKIRDVVSEDVHRELKKAGELYKPTGGVLKDYGSSLAGVHAGLQSLIDDCNALWAKYQSELADVARLNPFGPDFPLSPSDPSTETDEEKAKREAHERAVDAAQGEADAALIAFTTEAEKFDGKYDSWDEAYELALSRIGDVTDGKIKDSLWDNISGFVEVALQVLAVIGMVLAVLCIIVGGPLFAILATVVGILTLIGTIYMMTQGHADGWDLAWAIVGVIPFGKLGTFLKPGVSVGSKVGTFAKGFLAIDEFGQLGSQFSRMGSAFSAGFASGPVGLRNFTGLWNGLLNISPGYAGDAGVLARYMGIESLTDTNALEVLGGHFGEIVLKGGGNSGRDLLGLIGDSQNSSTVDTWRSELARNR